MATAKRKFKTKKKLGFGGPKIFRKWAEYSEGDVLIGTLKGTHHDAKYKKDHFIINVIDAQLADRKFAKTLIDQDLVLNSSGKLDKQLKEVDDGDIVQITYNGMAEMESGPYAGTEAHQHDVEIVVDEDDADDEDEESEEDDEYEIPF